MMGSLGNIYLDIGVILTGMISMSLGCWISQIISIHTKKMLAKCFLMKYSGFFFAFYAILSAVLILFFEPENHLELNTPVLVVLIIVFFGCIQAGFCLDTEEE